MISLSGRGHGPEWWACPRALSRLYTPSARRGREASSRVIDDRSFCGRYGSTSRERGDNAAITSGGEAGDDGGDGGGDASDDDGDDDGGDGDGGEARGGDAAVAGGEASGGSVATTAGGDDGEAAAALPRKKKAKRGARGGRQTHETGHQRLVARRAGD